MRRSLTFALVLTLALAAACSNEQKQTSSNESSQQPVTSSAKLTPEELGEMGAQIRKNPDDANEILARHGLDQQKFEKAIRDVTEDPDASKRYAAAYRKASA